MNKYVLAAAMAATLVLSGCGDIESSEKKAEGVTKGTVSVTEADTSEVTDTTTSTAETTAEVTTTAEITTTEVTTAAETTLAETGTDDHNIIPGVSLWDDKDDVLSEYGAWDYEYENSTTPSATYCYMIDGSDIFGVDIPGYKFFEFEQKNDRLICYGYHFGCMLDKGEEEFPFSQEVLAEGYKKVTDKLIQWYGGEVDESGGSGLKGVYLQELEDGSQMWSVYGEDMWTYDDSELSGINEIVVSLSISDEDRETL